MGKEQMARQIYLQSSRTQKPLIVLEAGGAALVGRHDPESDRSEMSNNEIFNQGGGKLFYGPLTLNNYTSVFDKIPIWKYFANSLFVALITTFGQVIISALAGYAFARLKFKWRDGPQHHRQASRGIGFPD